MLFVLFPNILSDCAIVDYLLKIEWIHQIREKYV